MRQSQKQSRTRQKSSRKPTSPSPSRVYESSGPEGKIRGTPQQLVEKYQSLARDKYTTGDRVLAESFMQHAEHYARILIAAQPQSSQNQQPQAQPTVQPTVQPRAEQPETEASLAETPSEPAMDSLAVIEGEAQVTVSPENFETTTTRKPTTRRRRQELAEEAAEGRRRPRRLPRSRNLSFEETAESQNAAAKTAEASGASSAENTEPPAPKRRARPTRPRRMVKKTEEPTRSFATEAAESTADSSNSGRSEKAPEAQAIG